MSYQPGHGRQKFTLQCLSVLFLGFLTLNVHVVHQDFIMYIRPVIQFCMELFIYLTSLWVFSEASQNVCHPYPHGRIWRGSLIRPGAT